MTAFYVVRVSRKQHRCDGDGYPGPCTDIKPGDVYVRATATPNHDGHGNQGWWTLRLCAVCAKFYSGPNAALVLYEQARRVES